MRAGVTLRAIIIGSILIPINSIWTIQHHEKFYAAWSIFYNVIFILLLLTLLNIVIRRFYPKAALSQGELLTTYIMLCMATSVGGKDTIQALLPIMARPFWFATPENEWKDLFWEHIPQWLSVRDQKVLRAFYEGDSSLYLAENIRAWLPPVLFWASFIFVLLFVMLCINVIIRRQWIEHEKLSYPVIQLPFEMTKSTEFFRSGLLWVGFGIAAGVNIIKGLHFIYPAVPDIPFIKDFYSHDLARMFSSRFWNSIDRMPITVMLCIVGFAFFIPLELSFSIWVFYFLRIAQRGIGGMIGWRTSGETIYHLTFIKWQMTGAYIGLAVFSIWAARGHLKEVLKQVFAGGDRDVNEPMSYRWAFLGIVAGLAFLVFFTYRAGMSLWVVIPYFLIYYFVVSLATTRIRAEVGAPIHELLYGGPTEMMIQTFGTRRLGPRNLSMFSMFLFYNRLYRSHPMPHQLEGFKLADRGNFRTRGMPLAIMLAVFIGIFSAFWRTLHVDFKMNGAVSSWVSADSTTLLSYWLSNPTGTSYTALLFTGMGMVFMIGMMFFRLRFIWWPFHPIGFPIAATWTMSFIWFSVILSWLAKWIILKQGGLHAYRRATPFFLGLLLGELTMGGIWDVLDRITGVTMYNFWW